MIMSPEEEDEVLGPPFNDELNGRLLREMADSEYPGKFRSAATTLGGSIGILRELVNDKKLSRPLAAGIARNLRIAMEIYRLLGDQAATLSAPEAMKRISK